MPNQQKSAIFKNVLPPEAAPKGNQGFKISENIKERAISGEKKTCDFQKWLAAGGRAQRQPGLLNCKTSQNTRKFIKKKLKTHANSENKCDFQKWLPAGGRAQRQPGLLNCKNSQQTCKFSKKV